MIKLPKASRWFYFSSLPDVYLKISLLRVVTVHNTLWNLWAVLLALGSIVVVYFLNFKIGIIDVLVSKCQ